MVSKEDVEKVHDGMKQGMIKLINNQRSIIKNVFNHRNQSMLTDYGVKYIRIDHNI